MSWYLIVIFICIFLVNNEGEHCFSYFWPLGRLLLWSDCSGLLPIFYWVFLVVFSLLILKSFIIGAVNIFSHSMVCEFPLFGIFWWTQFPNFSVEFYHVFSIQWVHFVSCLRNLCQLKINSSILLRCPSFTFRFIFLEVNFVWDANRTRFIFSICISNWLSVIYWKNIPPLLWSTVIINHLSIKFISASRLYSLPLVSLSVLTLQHCLNHCSFTIDLDFC